MSCVIYPWDNVPGGQFSSGQLCRRQIIWKPIENFPRCQFPGILSGASYLWDKFPGMIDNFPVQLPEGQLSGDQFFLGAIILRDICPWGSDLGAIIQGAIVYGAIIRGVAIFLRGNCLDTPTEYYKRQKFLMSSGSIGSEQSRKMH